MTCFPDTRFSVLSVTDQPELHDFGPEVVFEMEEQVRQTYRNAADLLNTRGMDVVCLQHEFGVYGGPAGSHILAFLEALNAPVVTTLHTLLQDPNPCQKRVTLDLIRLSQRLVVMSGHMERMLLELYDVDPAKIDRIDHGIPDICDADSEKKRDDPRLKGKRLVLTFGLLSPGKGIEHAIRALPAVIKQHPDLLYLIVGATHPNLLRLEGESYRSFLENLVKELDLQQHVHFENRFVELSELKEYLAVADVYVTPYTNEAQAVSGTLAYAFGCGKPVISTPYWHARELLNRGDGVLVPFGDSPAVGAALTELLLDDRLREEMSRRAFRLGRQMLWPKIAAKYMKAFVRARQEKKQAQFLRRPSLSGNGKPASMPPLNLGHLQRMTDSTGIFQHALYTSPNFSEGYCTDDNARGLMLTCYLRQPDAAEEAVQQLRSTFLAFLAHAFDRSTGRFRNFMSFDRRWLEKVGSTDSHGRAIWALGHCLRYTSGGPPLAFQLFTEAAPAVREFESLRSCAFSLLGIVDYLERFRGDRKAAHIAQVLSERLQKSFGFTSTRQWCWFEEFLSYDNPRLSQALIASGLHTGCKEHLETGLKSLDWLVGVQEAEGRRYFQPVGSNSLYRKNQAKPQFDQQPVEAWATLSACLEAFRATSDRLWYNRALQAFEWYLGRNDLGLPVYDSSTGGCRDGIHPHRLNENQGAESTLSFLIARGELQRVQKSLFQQQSTSFPQPAWSTA
jgi:glycosyltransferase involved in cell wall biosynthesis